tara:strand:- start:3859 stop:5520 length:1662 start_codon:yes stop_codon:yes gene_type:complete
MKRISLGIAQRVSEYNYLIKKMSIKKENFVMIPLNLETLLYYKKNNIKYINLLEILNNKIHKDSIKIFQKIIPQIEKSFIYDDILKKRYIGILRKYFNSIFFVLKIIDKIKKKNIIDKIYLSGWDSYSFKDIKKNFFVSRIVNELFQSKIDIVLVDKLKNEFSQNNLSIILPKKIKYNYIYLNNLGYNFKKIVIKNFFLNRLKILTPEDNNLSLLKKFLYRLLFVKFLKFKETKLTKSNINMPIMKFKISNKNIVKLLNFRSTHIIQELASLINEKNQYLNLFKIKKPNKFFLNNSRGINSYLIDYAKKEKILCFLISHGTLSHQKNYYSKMYNNTIAEEVSEKRAINCAQSGLALSYLKHHTNKKNLLKTGNLIFSNGDLKNKNYYLYAVTNRDFVNTHFYGIETFYEFFDNLKFLNNYSKKNKLKIIVKLHPGVIYLNSELSSNFKNLYFSNTRIEKLLKNSKAVISFSSTVIEDALNLRLPIILLDRWKRYNHFSKANFLKSKRVKNYVNNTKDLDKIIKNFDLFKKNFSFEKTLFGENPFYNFEKLLKM